MTTAETEAMDLLYQMERGWHDGGVASDPNPTLDGVTQKTYNRWRRARGLPEQSVRRMTTDERVAIYREWWRETKADRMPDGVAAIHFWFAFNSGPADAAKALQTALGVTPDGMIGPITLAAVQAADPRQLIPALLLEQVCSYHDEAIRIPRLRPNMTSWMGRVARGWVRYGRRKATP